MKPLHPFSSMSPYLFNLSPMKIKLILLIVTTSFFILVHPLNPPFVTYNESRFEKIYLPKQHDFFFPDLFGYSTFISPVGNSKISTSTELCQKSERELKSFESSLWNNSFILNPCSQYFCKRTQGYNDTNLHYSAHRYCLQCINTISENLTLSQNCSLIDQNYCKDCTEKAKCIYHEKDFPLCYRPDWNKFYKNDDFTHMGLVFFYFNIFPFLSIGVSFILFLLFLIILIIPNVVYNIKEIKMNRMMTFLNKMNVLFNLPFQTMSLFWIATIVSLIASLIDILMVYAAIDLQPVNALGSALFINAGLMLVGLISLVIYWFYIVRLMDTSKSTGSFKRYFALYIISMVTFFILGLSCALFYILYRFIDQTKRVIWIYFLGSSLFLIILICAVVILSLFIISIFILNNLIKTKNQSSNLLELALKLKVNTFFLIN